MKLILEEKWVKESPNPIPELAEDFQVPEELMKKRLEDKRGRYNTPFIIEKFH